MPFPFAFDGARQYLTPDAARRALEQVAADVGTRGHVTGTWRDGTFTVGNPALLVPGTGHWTTIVSAAEFRVEPAPGGRGALRYRVRTDRAVYVGAAAALVLPFITYHWAGVPTALLGVAIGVAYGVVLHAMARTSVENSLPLAGRVA